MLVLPNTHSKHRYQRVSRLCDVSDVKTAGKPHPTPGRKHGVLAMLGREKAKHPLPVQRVVVYLLALSRASVFNVTPIMSLWASRVSRQSGEREDWDYTLQGLAQINKESIDAIREAVRELERAGYIKRSRERDERGCLRGTVYTIYEQPHAEPTPEEPTQALPTLDHPTLEKPMLDFPNK